MLEIATSIQTIKLIMLIISSIIHIIFAGAVARDAGQMNKRGLSTHLVSSTTWSFATLFGGALVAAAYWFMHHLRYKPH